MLLLSPTLVLLFIFLSPPPPPPSSSSHLLSFSSGGGVSVNVTGSGDYFVSAASLGRPVTTTATFSAPPPQSSSSYEKSDSALDELDAVLSMPQQSQPKRIPPTTPTPSNSLDIAPEPGFVPKADPRLVKQMQLKKEREEQQHGHVAAFDDDTPAWKKSLMEKKGTGSTASAHPSSSPSSSSADDDVPEWQKKLKVASSSLPSLPLVMGCAILIFCCLFFSVAKE